MGIYRRPDSPYWWLFLETTKQKEKTQITVGTTTVQRRESKRLALEYYHQRMNELAAHVHRLPTKPGALPTFNQVADLYETNELPHHRGQEREREILPRLRAAFGSLRLSEIDQERVKTWRTGRRATATVIEHFGGPKGPRREFPPPSARTVNREVDILQQILQSAVPKYLKVSPLEGLPDLEVIEPIRRTMSHTEEARILAALAPDDRAILICGCDTLSRLGDILDLKRTDDHGDVLDIRDPKNGRPHTVPISTRLRAALDAIPHHESEWYFVRRRQAVTDRDRRGVIAKALQRACRQAGVPYGRAVRGITFHWATRRTGATRMIRAAGDKAIATTQRIGNWKDPSVLIGIYQETITEDMRAAVESVSRKLRQVK